ncbi:hypothetical protein ACW7BJ_01710 [Azospirillum argentinense]
MCAKLQKYFFPISAVLWAVACAPHALAFDVTRCSGALVKQHIDKGGFEYVQESRSYAVEEDAWRHANSKHGANAILYGVPVGASYEDYKATRDRKFHMSNERRAKLSATWQVTEDLGENSVEAYRACLGAGDNTKLSIYPTNVTACGLNVAVDYNAGKFGPKDITLQVLVDPTEAVNFNVIPKETKDNFVRRFPIRRPAKGELRIIVESNEARDSDELLVPSLASLPIPPSITTETRDGAKDTTDYRITKNPTLYLDVAHNETIVSAVVMAENQAHAATSVSPVDISADGKHASGSCSANSPGGGHTTATAECFIRAQVRILNPVPPTEVCDNK